MYFSKFFKGNCCIVKWECDIGLHRSCRMYTEGYVDNYV